MQGTRSCTVGEQEWGGGSGVVGGFVVMTVIKQEGKFVKAELKEKMGKESFCRSCKLALEQGNIS